MGQLVLSWLAASQVTDLPKSHWSVCQGFPSAASHPINMLCKSLLSEQEETSPLESLHQSLLFWQCLIITYGVKKSNVFACLHCRVKIFSRYLSKLYPDIKLQRNILLTASSRNIERIILTVSKLFITVEETKNRHIWKRGRSTIQKYKLIKWRTAVKNKISNAFTGQSTYWNNN